MYDPDWSVISNSFIDNGAYANILPGDAKVDAKWWPSMITEAKNLEEWQKVMSQILAYMISDQNRYGFILTDANMVVLRITRRHIGGGLAASRPRRDATPATLSIATTVSTTATSGPVATGSTGTVAAAGHQRHISDTSMLSGATSSASSYEGDSSFRDDNPFDWDYHPPEHVVIPWDAHGSDTLTIKLALWCLAMMAANGDRCVDYSYPGLNTWRQGGKESIHNTPGASLERLSPLDPRHKVSSEAKNEKMGGGESLVEPEGGSARAVAVEDAPYHSQPGSTFGDDYLQEMYEDDEGGDSDDGESEEEPVEQRN